MKSFWDMTIEEREQMAKFAPNDLKELFNEEKENLIKKAPSERVKTRLMGIQMEIDRTLSTIKNPLMRAIKINEIMMHTHSTGSFNHLNKALLELSGTLPTSNNPISSTIDLLNTKTQASVLEFKRKVTNDGDQTTN